MLNTSLYFQMYRISRSQMFFKIGFLQKNFLWNIAEFLRIAIFIEHFWWLLECRVIIMKQVQVTSTAFLRCIFRKIFLKSWRIRRRISTQESDLSRLAPVTLLLSLFVMDNFLEILQKFRKIVFNRRSNSQ